MEFNAGQKIKLYVQHMYYICTNACVAVDMLYTCKQHVINLKHHICNTYVAQLAMYDMHILPSTIFVYNTGTFCVT